MSATKKQIKSPSERLRGVYYHLWEQDNQNFKEFDDFYDSKMEKLINHFKGMINVVGTE